MIIKTVYIITAMRDLTLTEIKAKLVDAEQLFRDKHAQEGYCYQVISGLDAKDISRGPIIALSNSIRKMNNVDIVFVYGDISNTRGCKVEVKVAEVYNLEIIREEE